MDEFIKYLKEHFVELETFRGGVHSVCAHHNTLVNNLNYIFYALDKYKALPGGGILPHFLDTRNENGVLVYYNVKGERANV